MLRLIANFFRYQKEGWTKWIGDFKIAITNKPRETPEEPINEEYPIDIYVLYLSGKKRMICNTDLTDTILNAKLEGINIGLKSKHLIMSRDKIEQDIANGIHTIDFNKIAADNEQKITGLNYALIGKVGAFEKEMFMREVDQRLHL